LSRLEPSRDAVEMEGMIAHTPGHGAVVGCGGRVVRLAFDAKIPANRHRDIHTDRAEHQK
jgi:hypothetical protein